MLTRIVEERVYDFGHVVGGRQLTGIYALAVGRDDEVFVVRRNPYSADVVRLSAGPVPGDEEIITQFGERGDGPGQFVWPAGIAVDDDQRLYVTDQWLHRVNVYNPDGEFLDTFGVFGDGDGQFNRPSGITVDHQGHLYIVDTLNHRVQRLDNEGRLIARWGVQGAEAGQFDQPWGITTDGEGSVYVADHQNHRVQKFDADGEFILQVGSRGQGEYGLDHPSDVAVDPDGDIYVCDWANSRVQAFDNEGNYLTTFQGDAQELSKWQKQYVASNPDVHKARRRVYSLEPEWRFALPMAVAFDNARSRLLVADSQRWRIQIYNKLLDYSDPQFNI